MISRATRNEDISELSKSSLISNGVFVQASIAKFSSQCKPVSNIHHHQCEIDSACY